MGNTEKDIGGDMTADEKIRFATQCQNAIAMGWDPAHDDDMTVFSIGIKVNDDRKQIVNAVASLAMNVFRQMAKDNMEEEIELTAFMMKVIAERQAERIAESGSDMAKMDSVTS